MAHAKNAQVQNIIVAESAWGATPASPNCSALPLKSNTLQLQKANFRSNDSSPDRQIRWVRHGKRTVAGDLVGDLRFGDFDALLASALQGTWTSDVLKAGTTETSFSVEKGMTDISEYMVYSGVWVNELSFNLSGDTDQFEATFSCLGKDMDGPNSTSIDSSPTAASANMPFDSFTGSILEGGTSACMTGLSFRLSNSGSPQKCLFSTTASGIVSGMSVITGTATFFITDSTLIDKFVNETETNLAWTLTDQAGNDLSFSLPAAKYITGDPVWRGGDGSMLLPMDFIAYYNSTAESNIVVTRSEA